METLTLEALMRSWIAGPLPESYEATLEAILDGLGPEATSSRAADACAQLAMLFGDSGAPELCVVVSYRGIALAAALDASDEEAFTARFVRHAFEAMADLGIERPEPGGDEAEPDGAAAWLRDFLAPLGGSLEAGTHFAARLAAIRAGLLPVPDPLTVDAVWAPRAR